jgi:hypothetical protein
VVEDVTITSMFSILIFGIYAWIVNMWIYDKPPDLSPVIISADPGTITRMLQQLQWDTLEERRARSRSIMLYTMLNNLVEVPLMVRM